VRLHDSQRPVYLSSLTKRKMGRLATAALMGHRAENLRNLETLKVRTGPSIGTNPALGASIMRRGQFPAYDS